VSSRRIQVGGYSVSFGGLDMRDLQGKISGAALGYSKRVTLREVGCPFSFHGKPENSASCNSSNVPSTVLYSLINIPVVCSGMFA